MGRRRSEKGVLLLKEKTKESKITRENLWGEGPWEKRHNINTGVMGRP